ncbi:hypothetical protein F4818DRAFT_183709 [Hypoxylon cercidicola]|nr:hypothetical protein F4818DRAFT_183709 [Hypoxylon cercidicola]
MIRPVAHLKMGTILSSSSLSKNTDKRTFSLTRIMASGDPSGEAAKKKASSKKKSSKDTKKRSSKSPSKEKSSSSNKGGSSGQGQGGGSGAYVSPPDFFSFNDPGDDFSAN